MIDLQERSQTTVELPTDDALPVAQVDVMTFANHFDDPSVRTNIDRLEKMMVDMGGKPIEARHYFANGLYAREIFIPKGTLLTGKIHKTEHLNIVSKGEISVLTEAGPQRVKAPFTIVSLPGTKRVGYAHEDTVWTTIHATTETDLEKLEAELIAESHEQYLQHASVKELEGN
jgi:hypothetical protein